MSTTVLSFNHGTLAALGDASDDFRRRALGSCEKYVCLVNEWPA